jgi:transcriptional regulator with XRE-family HTH domain
VEVCLRSGQTERATEIDRLVGARIRARRIAIGLSQLELAAQIDCTYQQLHKYERGINRLSAGRLLRCAQALRVSVDYFFDRLDEGQGLLVRRERMMLELARLFNEIPEERHRVALAALVQSLAAAAPPRVPPAESG